MDKFLIRVSEDIASDVKKTVENVTPMGHICVCYLNSDREFAQKATSQLNEFEYKITRIEFPDKVELQDESAQDIADCGDDVRVVLGIGGWEIASLICRACNKRRLEYALITDTPFLYGVGYSLRGAQAPISLLIDVNGTNSNEDYAKCVGLILAYRVALWEKKYINYMTGKQDDIAIITQQELLDSIICDGRMFDKQKIFDGILQYSKMYDTPYKSSVEILAELITHVSLDGDIGESLLIAAVSLVKYFKAIMSVEEYSLIVPADISSHCRLLSKILDTDVSDIIAMVKDRKFESKRLYIHEEYRQDMLEEILQLDGKLPLIIKSAKRFMSDVGYHLGESYDIGKITQLVYNLSPIVHECSPLAIADVLLG